MSELNINQRTLVLVKPDGVERGLVGEIIHRFEKVGLKIIGLKMVKVDADLAFKHYGQNEEWFEKIGEKVREFYNRVGYDPGEEFNKLSNRQIGELVQKWNVEYLVAGPVVAIVLEGPHAIEVVRKIIGPTYPEEAPPGTIRGDYALDSPLTSNLEKRSVRNLIHASSKLEEADLEIKLWFKEDELINL